MKNASTFASRLAEKLPFTQTSVAVADDQSEKYLALIVYDDFAILKIDICILSDLAVRWECTMKKIWE
jgi:hypothetical protein